MSTAIERTMAAWVSKSKGDAALAGLFGSLFSTRVGRWILALALIGWLLWMTIGGHW
jgi:hypothetical protein